MSNGQKKAGKTKPPELSKAEWAKKSREVSKAIIFSKHERLAKALMMLQIFNKK